jgi:hypothetical protein
MDALAMSELPPGFVLDPSPMTAGLPPGFVLDQPPPKPRSKPATEAELRGESAGQFFKGVPIAGAYVDQAGAAIQAAAHPLTGAGEEGETFSERYAKDLARKREVAAQYEQEHPVLSTATQLGGGALITAPLGATVAGARVLGLAGRTLPTQIAGGIASGASINAADALARGTDPLTAAVIGGGLGGLAAPVTRGAGMLVSPVINTVRGIVNPAEEAARRVGGAVSRDVAGGSAGLTPQEFQAAQAAGQPVNVMDLGGETTRALARSAANTSPEGRAVLNRAINDRFELQSTRLTDWLRSTFHYPDAPAQQAALAEAGRNVNRVGYATAHNDPAAQAMWDEGFQQLMQAPVMQEAARGATRTGANQAAMAGFAPVRNPFEFHDVGSLTPRYTQRVDNQGRTILPNLGFWDQVKRNLDDQINTLQRSGANSAARDAQQLRTALVSHLDELVPSYAQARAGAAHFFGAEHALEAGQNFVNSRLGNREARLALAQMNSTERQLFQDGFVDRFVQQLRETPDRRSVLNAIANSPASVERLHIALGPQRAGELEAMMRVEHVMDLARPAVQGNSTTARQLAELGLAGGVGTITGGGNPLDPQSLVHAALVYGALRGRGAINERVSRQVAQLLASGASTRIAQGIRMAAQPRMLGALRNADAALARAGSVQAGRTDQRFP